MKRDSEIRTVCQTSGVAVTLSACWILGFCAMFFAQELESPDIRRTDLWLMMADSLLGFDQVAADVPGTDPPSGLRFVSQRLPLFGMALVLLTAAAMQGEAILRLLRLRMSLYRSERLVLRLGLGLSVTSLMTLLGGLFGQLSPTALFTPALVSLVVVVATWFRSPSASRPVLPTPAVSGRCEKLVRPVTLLVMIPFAVYLLLGAVSPPSDFDVREYHLMGPREWFEQGRITFLRHNVYTSFPFHSEMLSLAAMVCMGDWWTGALTGQIVLACFQLLSTVCVYAIARRWIGGEVPWLAALIYLTTPWTLRISINALSEGSLTFYLTAAAMTALLLNSVMSSADRWRIVLFTGLLAGSAMASKYTGLISVVLPTGCLVVLAIAVRGETAVPRGAEFHACDSDGGAQPGVRSILRAVVIYALGVSAVTAPWLGRNFADTGNPVYPLAWRVFGGREWSAEMDARWKPAHAADEHHPSLILSRHFPDVTLRNKWTSPLLTALALPSLLLWRHLKLVRVLWCLVIWGFGTWWGLTHRIDRFWIPLIPLLSLLAGCAWLLSAASWWKRLLLTTIAVATVFNVWFCSTGLVGFHAGLMDLNTARDMPMVAGPGMRFLNRTLPASARVLMVGEASVFDSGFHAVYHTVFDDCIFEEWTTLADDRHLPVRQRRMQSADDIRRTLRTHGITHVYVNWGEILRYRTTYGYTEYVQPLRFRQLVDQNVLRPPLVVVRQPLSGLDDSVWSWDGAEQLAADGETFAVSELYEVSPASD